MIDPSPGKAALRATLRAARRGFVDALDAAARDSALDALTARVIAAFPRTGAVAAYIPVGAEIDPTAILEAAARVGHKTALPFVTDRATPMRFLAWTQGDPLFPGPLGLRQPDPAAPEIAPALIVTPLLGFDRALNRLGQGAGFYDRAFALHPEARRIGVAWSVQEVADLACDPWDVPLHAIATEKDWIVPETPR